MDDTTDPTQDSSNEAATPRSAAGKVNDQFGTLNRFRRERTRVDVYLVNGLCLHGQIKSFDRTMMLLESNTGDIALYLHAISTVARAQKRAKPRHSPGPDYRSQSPHDGAPSRVGRDRPARRFEGADDGEGGYPMPRRPSPDRVPQVIIKGRRSRSIIKPE